MTVAMRRKSSLFDDFGETMTELGHAVSGLEGGYTVEPRAHAHMAESCVDHAWGHHPPFA